MTNTDESKNRLEVKRLVLRFDANNLQLHPPKTKEMIVDFTKKKTKVTPIIINGELTERVNSFKFLSKIISNELGWENTVVKRLKKKLYFLRQLNKSD